MSVCWGTRGGCKLRTFAPACGVSVRSIRYAELFCDMMIWADSVQWTSDHPPLAYSSTQQEEVRLLQRPVRKKAFVLPTLGSIECRALPP
eukprot:gene12359-biopygen6011